MCGEVQVASIAWWDDGLAGPCMVGFVATWLLLHGAFVLHICRIYSTLMFLCLVF